MLNELMSLFGGLSPEQQIETMKYGTNAIGKLGLTIGKVFGYFYEPTHIKKLADAESYKREKLADAKAYEIETVGEAIKREKFLPLIYNSEDGTVSIDISDTTQLMQRSELRLRYSQIQKQHNIESVIGKTALELEGKDANIAEEVDKDWLNRYFNIVEDISDEELQNLWARILAGEILKPKTNSLRLLDFLRNTSREELDILLKVMPFIAEKYIYNELNILDKYGISYELILKLDEWGVLNSSGLTRVKVDVDPNKPVIIFENDTLILIAKNESQSKLKISLPAFTITEIGISLLRLSRVSLNISFIKEIITVLSKKYNKVVFSLHSKKGNTINYNIPIFEIRND